MNHTKNHAAALKRRATRLLKKAQLIGNLELAKTAQRRIDESNRLYHSH